MEEILENVQFCNTYSAAINIVENLQKYESIEYVCEEVFFVYTIYIC